MSISNWQFHCRCRETKTMSAVREKLFPGLKDVVYLRHANTIYHDCTALYIGGSQTKNAVREVYRGHNYEDVYLETEKDSHDSWYVLSNAEWIVYTVVPAECTIAFRLPRLRQNLRRPGAPQLNLITIAAENSAGWLINLTLLSWLTEVRTVSCTGLKAELSQPQHEPLLSPVVLTKSVLPKKSHHVNESDQRLKDVQIQETNLCRFRTGQEICGKPVGLNDRYCADHLQERCIVCRGQATRRYTELASGTISQLSLCGSMECLRNLRETR